MLLTVDRLLALHVLDGPSLVAWALGDDEPRAGRRKGAGRGGRRRSGEGEGLGEGEGGGLGGEEEQEGHEGEHEEEEERGPDVPSCTARWVLERVARGGCGCVL